MRPLTPGKYHTLKFVAPLPASDEKPSVTSTSHEEKILITGGGHCDSRKNTVGFAGLMVALTPLTVPPG